MIRPFRRDDGSGPPAVERAAELLVTYGFVAFIVTLPLEFTGAWLRQQLSRYVLVAVAIAFLYLVVTGRRQIRAPRSLSAFFLLVYVLASLISWSITRPPGSTTAVLAVVMYPIAGLLITNVAPTSTDQQRAWTAFIASGLGVSILGAVLYLTHTAIWTPNPVVAARLNITFGDPNITARFLTLCAGAAVMMFAARRGPPWLALAAAAACAIVLPLTWSRSGLALFIFGIVLAVVAAFQHRRAAAIGALALILFALSTSLNPETRLRAVGAVDTVVAAVTGTSANISHPTTQSNQDPFALEDNRKYLVAAGLRMFSEHPVFGVGFGGYQHALLTRYSSFLPPGPTARLDTLSHASVVTVMAEQGAAGTVLMLAFLVALARESIIARRRRDQWSVWSTVGATLILPIFLYSQFEGRFLQEPYLWLCLGLFYSAQLAVAQTSRELIGAAEPEAA